MKSERRFEPVTVNKKAERGIRAGHPWVYGAELVRGVPEGFE
ncbi:MAG: hypothetical protein J5584_02520, partial [Clostridia bacterium]|nr:hypothetical protein [Clostridia bacterium]